MQGRSRHKLGTTNFSNIDLFYSTGLLLYSYYHALMNVEDLMELDYVFAKVMLYMCPHNDLVVVLQRVDPILASKFYIWYVKNHGKEYIKDPQVTTLILIAIHMHHARVICMYSLLQKMTSV